MIRPSLFVILVTGCLICGCTSTDRVGDSVADAGFADWTYRIKPESRQPGMISRAMAADAAATAVLTYQGPWNRDDIRKIPVIIRGQTLRLDEVAEVDFHDTPQFDFAQSDARLAVPEEALLPPRGFQHGELIAK